jgi:hypothetical protein
MEEGKSEKFDDDDNEAEGNLEKGIEENDCENEAYNDEEEMEGSTEYSEFYQNALSADLSYLENANIIGVGQDSSNQNCVYVIPRIGLELINQSHTENEIIRDMSYLYVKIVSTLTDQPYSLIYCHYIFSVYTQVKMVRHLYKILPRRYKKNLNAIYIIHPTTRVHLFFKLSKLFSNNNVYAKCKFMKSISHLQLFISPLYMQLPLRYIQYDDSYVMIKYKHNVTSMPLILSNLYDSTLTTPRFIHDCVEYIKVNNGINSVGLFRIAGDELLFQLIQMRIKNNCNNIILRDIDKAYCEEGDGAQQGLSENGVNMTVTGGSINSKKYRYLASSNSNVESVYSEEARKPDTGEVVGDHIHHLADIVVESVDIVAQVGVCDIFHLSIDETILILIIIVTLIRC